MSAPNYVVEFMRNRQMPMDVDTYCRCNFTRATPTSEKTHSLFLTIQSRIGDMPYTSLRQPYHTEPHREHISLCPSFSGHAGAENPPPAETSRVFAWASSGRSEWMPSQFFSNWVK